MWLGIRGKAKKTALISSFTTNEWTMQEYNLSETRYVNPTLGMGIRIFFCTPCIRTNTNSSGVRICLKCDGTCTDTRFRLSAKRTSPFKSAGASVQSTTGSQGVRISGSNAGYIIFRGSVKVTGYPLHSLVSPSLPLPCVTVCHHISTGLSYVI